MGGHFEAGMRGAADERLTSGPGADLIAEPVERHDDVVAVAAVFGEFVLFVG